MKRLILFCLILLGFFKNEGQNLVPNPSFENFSDCTYGLVNNANNWELLNNGATSSLLTACQTDSYLRTPRQYMDNCFKSYQTVRTGSSYTEVGVYTTFVNSQESGHPACKLIDTLEVGKIYCVTYYVSMWNNARYSIDKLGALFTPTPFPYYVTGTSTPTFSMAGLYTPQIISTPGVAYEDTLGWEEVSGTFTAVGNEAYFTLGDFFLHNQHYIKNSYPTNCNTLAEYYVDDVSVEVVEIAKAINDTLIMQGDSVVIGNNASEAALFSWQPSSGLSCINCPNPKASPTITTTYTVTKTQCKAVTSDVITISVSPTGISEQALINFIKISPNPTNDILSIDIASITNKEMLTIEIKNNLGQVVYASPYTSQINISDLSAGIYFLVIQNKYSSKAIKVVKQ
jgi:hypothetical protein